ncbi:radical SAM protein [Streptomyces sp. G45]|uniref:radical SAM protein n=1 Tax=Streptomyces sp. G45 TaxID=3406627 RepID=UPI003C2386DE
MTTAADRPATSPTTTLNSLALELTGGCQLTCAHCLSSSSPQGTHGTMSLVDWAQVIQDAVALEAPRIQLISGEPTLHPHWVELVDLALSLGRQVEVFTNLFHVRPAWWEVFARDGVTLATSYYSDRAAEHDRLTTRLGSHVRTRANIAEAHRRGIPLRVGIVEVLDGQRVHEARAEIDGMGITEVGTDRVRAVGRAAGTMPPTVDALCGHCGRGHAAVLPNGDLVPCVMARFMPCGNVRERRLADLLGSEPWRQAVDRVPAPGAQGCNPPCEPNDSCKPHTPACLPKFTAAPFDASQDGAQ